MFIRNTAMFFAAFVAAADGDRRDRAPRAPVRPRRPASRAEARGDARRDAAGVRPRGESTPRSHPGARWSSRSGFRRGPPARAPARGRDASSCRARRARSSSGSCSSRSGSSSGGMLPAAAEGHVHKFLRDGGRGARRAGALQQTAVPKIGGAGSCASAAPGPRRARAVRPDRIEPRRREDARRREPPRRERRLRARHLARRHRGGRAVRAREGAVHVLGSVRIALREGLGDLRHRRSAPARPIPTTSRRPSSSRPKSRASTWSPS